MRRWISTAQRTASTTLRWGLVLCQRGEMSEQVVARVDRDAQGPKVRRPFAGGNWIGTSGSAMRSPSPTARPRSPACLLRRAVLEL